jgi:hypothetical protein
MNMTMPKAHTLLEEPDVELAILDGEGDDE